MFRWEQQKSGEEWSCDRRILAAAAEFPPPLRLLIAERLELLAETGRSPSEADMAATFAGFPPPEADVLLRLWLAFSYERLTAIAEWGEARPEMKGKIGEAQRYDMLAGLLTAAPQRPDSDWVETVMWLTNLLAEMPETTRLRLRRLIESEVGKFENDDQSSSEPAESVEPATAPCGRTRSEAEIADLVPYVSGSAIDAVRDALRRIVLENQDHSEILDKLLPELEQMPSKRSQALDWLDVEFARLSDDGIISFVDRLKREGGDEVQLKRETGGSAHSDDPPAVEPEQPPAQPSRRRRWMMPATIAACLPVVLLLGLGWGAERERERNLEFRDGFGRLAEQVHTLKAAARHIETSRAILRDHKIDDPVKHVKNMEAWFDLLLPKIEAVADECESVGDDP